MAAAAANNLRAARCRTLAGTCAASPRQAGGGMRITVRYISARWLASCATHFAGRCEDPSLCSDTTVGVNGGSGSRFPGAQRKLKVLPRDTFNTLKLINKPFIGRLSIVTLLASRRLAPTSFTGKPALQKVGGGRSSNQVHDRKHDSSVNLH
ncbi:protein TRANSPARENT TESTA 12-like [Dorcoceras hygrometricum]|uniref:Protein TRANSPARENT TESTA 12-like n=1 Tax=Dorcoceras hygrometricum TaxID=472368 RepID=A0A2Z7BI54_9LAMI|nr:protein TRANSPARENT TESTA 12-like [Dorcoceras hygrometricum]